MGLGEPEDPDSSTNKRRRMNRGTAVPMEDLGFHTELRKLPVNKNTMEIYVHVISKIPEKPIKRLNRWLLEKNISKVTNAISKASFNREGDLILKVKGEDAATKLINTEKLGEWPVEIKKHATLNNSKGVVFSTDMCWQNEDDIVAALQDRCNVKEVYIPKRRRNASQGKQEDQLIPSGIIIITFNQVEPPTVIPYGFEKLNVRPYIPNPMKCVLCQELGHTKNKCNKGYILCRECGHESGTDHSCRGKRCVNCKAEDHAANDRNCPSYLRAKEIEKIMVLNKKTRYEARKQFYECFGSLENFMELRGLTAAEILKRATRSKDQDKQTAEKPTTPNKQGPQKTNPVNKTMQLTPIGEDTSMQSQTATEQSTSTKDNTNEQVEKIIKNKFRLVRFKHIDNGITYYIKANFKEGKTPHLDLSNFKGRGKEYTRELSYLKNLFAREEMLNAIQLEFRKTPDNQVLEVTNQNEQIFLKTSPNLDMELSEDSECSDVSLEVHP